MDLENNKFTGFLPKSFSNNLVEIESINVANNMLSGPIPEDIIYYEDLQEAYFHGNNFMSMPSSVCNGTEILSSTIKVLTADCDEVSCSCCTECFINRIMRKKSKKGKSTREKSKNGKSKKGKSKREKSKREKSKKGK